jgi:SAM-dependent methyltransferase
MTETPKKDAWNILYGNSPRAWRGVSSVPDTGISGRVLDAGCGNGKTSAALAEKGFEVYGIDFSEKAVEYCRKNYGNNFEVSDCTSVPFPDSFFGGVFAVHLTEHLDDGEISVFASECMRILCPGGRVFVRSFSPGDMRDDGREFRNGIYYRYRTSEEIVSAFEGFDTVFSKTKREKTRFGKTRVISECLFSKPITE